MGSIKEFEKPEKVGSTTMIKEADAIIYQVESEDLKIPDLEQWEMPSEIGLGDPKDRERASTHDRIKQEIKGEFKKNINVRTRNLLWLDEKKEANLSLDPQWYKSFDELSDAGLLKYFQEMLERYQIKKLWVFGEEKGKEIFERMEKIVWDAQTSAYAKKQGMTNAEFLRWRLTRRESEKE
ncbi:MAG: hypothetical protein V1688_03320 [bacterium]